MIEKWEYFDADRCKGLAVEFTRVLDTGRLKLEKTMMLSRQSLRSLRGMDSTFPNFDELRERLLDSPLERLTVPHFF